jgi:hypothetical protein
MEGEEAAAVTAGSISRLIEARGDDAMRRAGTRAWAARKEAPGDGG